MAYKWRPNASQRRAFAERMQNPEERAAYEQRKADKAAKRRGSSQFDYNTAGGFYIPTQEQHDFTVFNRPADLTPEQEDACNQVAYGYSCQTRVHHDYIHIVNELRRKEHI